MVAVVACRSNVAFADPLLAYLLNQGSNQLVIENRLASGKTFSYSFSFPPISLVQLSFRHLYAPRFIGLCSPVRGGCG
jgi:hypothetical protein